MAYSPNDTIIAPATASGTAAIALIRISGANALSIVAPFFKNSGTSATSIARSARKQLFGTIQIDGKIIDEVLLSYFKGPNSYTGQDSIEISCHGSPYILQQLLQLFLSNGARMAEPGEFTMRAFLNGKMDLSQAEAVSDLINSHSAISHQMAMQQMRGGFSSTINYLRDELIHFASLIELELDFSEEDVEFADRTNLLNRITGIKKVITDLLAGFTLGNVLKNGIPVAIAGRPNAGKSTLLNALLNEERAIVSDIPGTTRDTIEDQITINGVGFRFIDTAGLRDTDDVIEKIGVDRALRTIDKSSAVIYLFDPHQLTEKELEIELEEVKQHTSTSQMILTANKVDTGTEQAIRAKFPNHKNLLCISAKQKVGLDTLRQHLLTLFDLNKLTSTDVIVSNARHAEALRQAAEALEKVKFGLESGLPGDLLALDIRFAIEVLGNITGKVTNEDLLTNIFTRFCIGK
jgi:tRNA modification GTPase